MHCKRQEDKQRKETERWEEKGKERKMSVKWAAYTHTHTHFYTEIEGENRFIGLL